MYKFTAGKYRTVSLRSGGVYSRETTNYYRNAPYIGLGCDDRKAELRTRDRPVTIDMPVDLQNVGDECNPIEHFATIQATRQLAACPSTEQLVADWPRRLVVRLGVNIQFHRHQISLTMPQWSTTCILARFWTAWR